MKKFMNMVVLYMVMMMKKKFSIHKAISKIIDGKSCVFHIWA